MRKRLDALLLALVLAGLLLAPAAARDQGFEHRGMPVRNHDRDRDRNRNRERFFFRHDPRFFRGGAAFFVPAPVYVNPYPAPLYYWYCANPPGYYPTVVQCFTAWQAVPVLP